MEKYSIAIIILGVLSVVYLKLAERFNIIDKPNNRSSHTIPTIRGGGILFFIAVWIFFFQNDFQYLFLILGITAIGVVSFIDDLKTLSSKVRLPFQFVAILLVMQEVDLFVLPWWVYIIVVIVGVGFINFYNFMDGINGITGLYSLSVLGGMYMINSKVGLIDPSLIIIVAISILIFGYYNFRRKARFFAGDIGSISIAVVLFYIGAVLIYRLESPIILLLIITYATDAILTIVYRKYLGERIMEPHRHHIYQKLVDLAKLGHIQVSIIYSLIQGGVCLIVYHFFEAVLITQWMIMAGIIAVFVLIYIGVFKLLEKRL